MAIVGSKKISLKDIRAAKAASTINIGMDVGEKILASIKRDKKKKENIDYQKRRADAIEARRRKDAAILDRRLEEEMVRMEARESRLTYAQYHTETTIQYDSTCFWPESIESINAKKYDRQMARQYGASASKVTYKLHGKSKRKGR